MEAQMLRERLGALDGLPDEDRFSWLVTQALPADVQARLKPHEHAETGLAYPNTSKACRLMLLAQVG